MTPSRLMTMGALLIVMYSGTVAAAEDSSPAPEPQRSWYSVSGLLAGRYEAVWNANPALDRAQDHNESRLLSYVTATLSVRPLDAIHGVLTLASREISRQTLDDGTVEDRWETTRFVDEAWIKASHRSSWIKVGKQRLVVGRGLVLDSYQPAVAGNLDVGATNPRVSIKAFGSGVDEDGILREDQSLYAGGRIDLSSPLVGRVSLSVSRLWDRDATIPTLLPTNVRLVLDDASFRADDGALTYWIVDATGTTGDWSLGGVAILQTGSLNGVFVPSIPLLSRPASITLLGTAGEVEAAYRVNHRFTVTAKGLYTSGDPRGAIDTVRDQRYEGFVGIYPLRDTTNLFFNGGIDSAFTSGTPTASGVLGRGVLAGTLTAEAVFDRTMLRLVAADLWSEFPLADGLGRHYGVEIDTEWAYAVTDWLTGRLEGDVLFPGSFYTDLDPNPEPIYKLAIGADVAW